MSNIQSNQKEWDFAELRRMAGEIKKFTEKENIESIRYSRSTEDGRFVESED